jgi:hypothetical protein
LAYPLLQDLKIKSRNIFLQFFCNFLLKNFQKPFLSYIFV